MVERDVPLQREAQLGAAELRHALHEHRVDRILREELGLSPTAHEPCLYCGEIEV